MHFQGQMVNFFLIKEAVRSESVKMPLVWSKQFLNDIIKSRHGFKTTQKFMKFLSSFKATSDVCDVVRLL